MSDNSALICRIYANCIEVGDCLEWQGRPNSANQMYISDKYVKKSVRRVLWEGQHGPAPKDRQMSVSCGNPKCVRHLQPITVKQKNKRIGAAGDWSTLTFRRKVAAARRRNCKLTEADASEIRFSDEDKAVLAERFGISTKHVNNIKTGTWWRDYSSPFAALMA